MGLETVTTRRRSCLLLLLLLVCSESRGDEKPIGGRAEAKHQAVDTISPSRDQKADGEHTRDLPDAPAKVLGDGLEEYGRGVEEAAAHEVDHEGAGDHRIVFTRSDDEGATWTKIKVIAGPDDVALDRQASWAFPMVSKSGRIYVLYNRSLGYGDFDKHLPDGWRDINWIMTSGLMEGIYSDDNGKTWSEAQEIKMPKSPLSNPDPNIPETWII